MASDSNRLGEGTSLAALGSENEHLRLAQEAGGIGTWEWSLPTDRMRWSAQMFRNLGMEPRPETESFALLMAAVHPGDRRRAESSFAEFRQQPGPLRVELRVVPAGGNIRWLVFLGKVVAGTDDKPVSMLGITIDGTLRRRSEDSVHDLASVFAWR
jgi:PAS domain-containing protein